MKNFDLIVIGAGPAGSSCAALCAESGLDVLILEAARFPRDKVCGDCLNPAVWPILDRLGVSSRVRSLSSSSPRLIRFSIAGLHSVEFPLQGSPGEFVVKRRDLDALLVQRAVEQGAHFQDSTPITSLRKISDHWEVTTSQGMIMEARWIVAADGRNSTVGRHLRMLAPPLKDSRIGLQTHIPHPYGYDGAIEMHLYRNGYGGLADLGEGLANLCLVANEGSMRELRKEAEAHYQVDSALAWRSITPISRRSARHLAKDGVFLCGDAAFVVEPFTGEGIAFALRTGSLLARILTSQRESLPGVQEARYKQEHLNLYRGKLRINYLTRFLSQHPKIAHSLGPYFLRSPGLLSKLTHRVLQTEL